MSGDTEKHGSGGQGREEAGKPREWWAAGAKSGRARAEGRMGSLGYHIVRV